MFFVLCILLLWYRNAAIDPFEISTVFLIGHLLSSITWKAHLVTLLFVFTAFFLIDMKPLSRSFRNCAFVLFGIIILLGSTGKDIVGATAHYYIGGWSLIAWGLVFLYAGALLFSVKPGIRQLPAAETGDKVKGGKCC